MRRLIPFILALSPLCGVAGGPTGGGVDEGVDAGVLPPLQLLVRAVPKAAKLGEPFGVEIVVTHLADQRYELSPPGDLGDFEYLGQERQRQDGKSSSTTTITAKLSAFALGKLKTPGLTLEVSSPQGTVTLPVPGVEVEIVSTLPPDASQTGANLYDVRTPEEVPVRTWRLLWALLGLALLALAVWGAVKWLNRPKPVVAAPAPPAESLDVRTCRALDDLAQQNLPGQGRFKEFYFRLSEILRGYLGERYGFEALESTTPELLDALRTRPTPGLPMEDVASFAHQSDFVRYAKAQPTVDECKTHLELAYRVVHATA
ncbi:MAG: hypothetical protein AB1938_05360, partial [Myxococcota bacterium]